MNAPVVLPRDGFDTLLGVLQRMGYSCVGPTVRDGAIVYGPLRRAEDLPEGWTDEQAPGHYRLRERSDRALFGYVVGPHSWKKYTFPAERRLWRLRRTEHGFEPAPDGEEAAGKEEAGGGDAEQPSRLAFLGVRACEIAALRIQDRVFTGGAYRDPHYASVRAEALVVAVSCTQSAATCFCTSMGTGPQVREGFDLELTELLDGPHRFLLRAGSEAGRAILEELPTRASTEADTSSAEAAVARAARQQRQLDPEGLPELLREHATSTQWDDNAGQPEAYRQLLPTMIGSWRDAWGQGDFPFGLVQLASFRARSNDPVEGGWALLREAQLMTAKNDENTGIVITTDVGDARDIHPRNKEEVGRRLALWARATVYGEDVPHSGPQYREMTRRGRELVLHFDHAEGLRTRDGQDPRGFALGDARGHFVWAKARIEGDTVVVSASDMPMPTVVRFGWCNNPEDTNLINGAGLPATPFRSNEPTLD